MEQQHGVTAVSAARIDDRPDAGGCSTEVTVGVFGHRGVHDYEGASPELQSTLVQEVEHRVLATGAGPKADLVGEAQRVESCSSPTVSSFRQVCGASKRR